ncbi:MAG TPA: helix-turn-helix transcriptional regulator [Planctomycetota bacterium]|nr:helix-turn-helix transcriptional regulator [Planctomycetota bacterium]
MDTIGAFLSRVRAEMDVQRLTETALGDLARVDGSTVNRILRGLQKPMASTVAKLAAALGLEVPFPCEDPAVGEGEAAYGSRVEADVRAACEVLGGHRELALVLKRLAALSEGERLGVYRFLGIK